MPRPQNPYETAPEDEPGSPLRSGHVTPLGLYLRQNSISLGAFSRAIGMPHKTVQAYALQGACPHLAAAAEIERLTKGAVPMEAWLGLPVCKTHVLRWRSKQPESSASARSNVDAGGFAQGAQLEQNALNAPPEVGR